MQKFHAEAMKRKPGKIKVLATNYFICDGSNRRELENSVAKMLPSGWVPIGGVAVRDNGWLYQAMVLYV